MNRAKRLNKQIADDVTAYGFIERQLLCSLFCPVLFCFWEEFQLSLIHISPRQTKFSMPANSATSGKKSEII